MSALPENLTAEDVAEALLFDEALAAEFRRIVLQQSETTGAQRSKEHRT